MKHSYGELNISSVCERVHMMWVWTLNQHFNNRVHDHYVVIVKKQFGILFDVIHAKEGGITEKLQTPRYSAGLPVLL